MKQEMVGIVRPLTGTKCLEIEDDAKIKASFLIRPQMRGSPYSNTKAPSAIMRILAYGASGNWKIP